MSALNDSILIDDLEENLDDDPYGTAIFVARNVIHRALLLEGTMNITEYKNLMSIEELIRTLDNA